MVIDSPQSFLVVWLHQSFQQVKRFHRQFVKGRQNLHTAETKLMLLSLAFVGLAVVALVYSSIATADLQEAFHSLEEYFACELELASGNQCNREAVEQYNHPVLNIITVVLLGLIPAVNFMFLVNWRVMKLWVIEVCFKRRTFLHRRGTVFFTTPTLSTFVKYSINEQPTFHR